MRAITFRQRLSYDENCPEPARADGDCLVRVHFAGICGTDLEITRGYMGFSGILGHEFVGTVVEGSSNWQGRRVACEINCVCRRCDLCQAGLSTHCRKRTVIGIAGRDGCFADAVAVPERNLHEIPDSISDEDAVFIEPLAAALQVVRQVPIESRMHVVVIGSGRLGLLVAQVLAATGCKLEVVGRNPKTLTFCEKLRIRSTQVTDLVPRNDRDVVVDCTGSNAGLELAAALVRPRGTVVLKSTHVAREPIDLTPFVINEVTLLGSRCGPFDGAIDALSSGDIEVSSMIARAFSLDRAHEAFQAADDPRNIKILLKINQR